jgi:hypothetical protein
MCFMYLRTSWLPTVASNERALRFIHANVAQQWSDSTVLARCNAEHTVRQRVARWVLTSTGVWAECRSHQSAMTEDQQDFIGHTATAPHKSFDVVMPAGGSGTLVVESPGTIDYFCRFHPMMKGKIIVQGG